MITFTVYHYADDKMLRVGYSKDLVIIGITIDTMEKYIFLQAYIFLIEFCFAVIYEYSNPIMYFSIFNEDKKVITDFSKLELQIYAQTLWFLTSIKNGLMLLVAIQQIDITISKIIYNEIAAAIVIRKLLNNKTFVSHAVSQECTQECTQDIKATECTENTEHKNDK